MLNVVETVGKAGSLVTGISYEPNTYSDSQFCRDFIHSKEAVPLEEREPEILITDGAYGGADNRKLAEENKMELVVTSLTGKETDEIFAGFTFNDEGTKVAQCPQGHAPTKTTYYRRPGCAA